MIRLELRLQTYSWDINNRKCPSNTSAVAAPDVSADASSDVLILQNIIESDRLPNLETVLL